METKIVQNIFVCFLSLLKNPILGTIDNLSETFSHICQQFLCSFKTITAIVGNGCFHQHYVEIFNAKFEIEKVFLCLNIKLCQLVVSDTSHHVFLIPCHVSPLESCIEFIKSVSCLSSLLCLQVMKRYYSNGFLSYCGTPGAYMTSCVVFFTKLD